MTEVSRKHDRERLEEVQDRSPAPVRERCARPWSSPRLRHLGDLRSLTLGPSVGNGESGMPTTFRP